jgi:hypothetical protein
MLTLPGLQPICEAERDKWRLPMVHPQFTSSIYISHLQNLLSEMKVDDVIQAKTLRRKENIQTAKGIISCEAIARDTRRLALHRTELF